MDYYFLSHILKPYIMQFNTILQEQLYFPKNYYIYKNKV